MFRRPLLIALALLFAASTALHLGGSNAQEPPTTATSPRFDEDDSTFTFQGRLTLDGVPANGNFFFDFYLYDSETAGLQLGLVESKFLTVTNGIFSVALNFGPIALFQGTEPWIEVRVKKPGDPGFVLLNPRQRITPIPVSETATTLNPGSTIKITTELTGLSVQSLNPGNTILGILGVNQLPDVLVGVAGFATSTNPATKTYGGNFNGGTAALNAYSAEGYGVRAKSEDAARAAVLAENTSSSCTGGNLGPDDPLQQYCYGLAGIADGESTGCVGVYGYGSIRGVWGATTSPTSYSGYFSGGKVGLAGGATIVTVSDARLKRDIASLSAGLDELLRLKPATYNFEDDAAGAIPRYGFIAQEVREVLPNLVDEDTDGTLAIEPLGLLPVIVHAIQQQQAQLDALGGSTGTAHQTVAAKPPRELPSNTILAGFAGALLLGIFGAGFAGVLAGKRLVR